jgi:hypothetical protein
MPRRDKWKTLVPVLIVFWLTFWLFRTRYAMLDDALIHLRYAANLHQLHIFSYGGLRPNFGASSVAYVGLLSVLRSATTTPLLAKVVSVVAYLALIATVAAFCLGMRSALATKALAYGALLCLLCPMGIRWLTDGMETGLVILAVLMLAWLTDRQAHSSTLTLFHAPILIAAGFLLVLLRIESLSLIAIASLIILLGKRDAAAEHSSRLSFFSAAMQSLPLAAGAILAALLVYLYFGTLLPDTAIAKTGAPSLEIALAGLQVIASSFILGIGTLLLWLLSAACLVRAFSISRSSGEPRAQFWMSVLANTYFPLILALACIRGQRIEGVRHVLWTLEFPLAWNILQLVRWDRAHQHIPLMPESLLRRVVSTVAIFFALLLPVDWAIAQRVMSQRAQTFLKMRATDFHQFQGKVVLAGDIGFIGYFTAGQVCDLDGLVNGRTAAQATPDQRYQACAQKQPAALFLSGGQIHRLGRYLDLHNWVACQTYDFVNVRTLDRHYLLLPAAAGTAECARFGGPVTTSL